jgi:hypothetical protein
MDLTPPKQLSRPHLQGSDAGGTMGESKLPWFDVDQIGAWSAEVLGQVTLRPK